MRKFIDKIFNNWGRNDKCVELKDKSDKDKRKELEIRVEKGADKAINEYGEVFKKLAEYDRK